MIDALDSKWVPIKGQRFEIGRTINPLKCNCSKCDFLNCDNYAKKMKFGKYTPEEFFGFYKNEMSDASLLDELLGYFIDYCAPQFPKGLYWSPDKAWSENRIIAVVFIRITRSGHEKQIGKVLVPSAQVTGAWEASKADSAFIHRFSKMIAKFYEAAEHDKT